jgi:hypothetical protein
MSMNSSQGQELLSQGQFQKFCCHAALIAGRKRILQRREQRKLISSPQYQVHLDEAVVRLIIFRKAFIIP